MIPVKKDQWNQLGEEFETANAEQILSHSIRELLKGGDLVFLTAFGPEGCVIFKMLADLINDGSLGEKDIIKSLDELAQHQSFKPILEESSSFTISQNDEISQQEKIISPQEAKSKSQDQIKHQQGKFIIANLDTGYQFKETLELKQQLEEKYKLPILLISPELSVKEQDEKHGKDLFNSDPDQCCYMRKLVPLNQLLEPRLAWITSIRRDQSEVRANAKAFEFDRKFKLGKINPLIHWTKSDIWKYIHENKIPYNPLLDQGYDSIGCEPCTSPGEGRKGRWAGKDKIECGLHIQDTEMTQGGEFTI